MIISFSVLLLLIVSFGLITFYSIRQQETIKAQIDKIKTEAIETREQATQIQNKAIEVKKYKELWKNLSDQKKDINGIKIDALNDTIDKVSSKYDISSLKLTATLPENLKGGVFDRGTVTVALTTVNLEFDAPSDDRVIAFATDLTKLITGRAIITNLEIKKIRPYTTQELISLSTKKSYGTIHAKINFVWYGYKPKSVISDTMTGINRLRNLQEHAAPQSNGGVR